MDDQRHTPQHECQMKHRVTHDSGTLCHYSSRVVPSHRDVNLHDDESYSSYQLLTLAAHGVDEGIYLHVKIDRACQLSGQGAACLAIMPHLRCQYQIPDQLLRTFRPSKTPARVRLPFTAMRGPRHNAVSRCSISRGLQLVLWASSL